MDVSDYLRRIKYEGALEPRFSTLRGLHLAHLYAVPFENLDVHLGNRITLDLDALFEKIVVRRRGGFCYELNGLFAWLLMQMGFAVTHLSASDAHGDDFGPKFDHLTLLVQDPNDTTQRWLADVGWGDTFREPLRFDDAGKQTQGRRAYRIERNGDYRFLWQRENDAEWERQYRFTLQPRSYSDFEEMCRYHQSSPESPFVKKRICTLATANGRITLSDSRFITTAHGEKHEELINDEETFRRILEERFGIRI